MKSIKERPQGKVSEFTAWHIERPSSLVQLGTIKWLPHRAKGGMWRGLSEKRIQAQFTWCFIMMSGCVGSSPGRKHRWDLGREDDCIFVTKTTALGLYDTGWRGIILEAMRLFEMLRGRVAQVRLRVGANHLRAQMSSVLDMLSS